MLGNRSNSKRPLAATVFLSSALPFRASAEEAGLPKRVKLLGWGENVGRTTNHRILVDEVVAASLAANQSLVACDLVPLDYEHQSCPGHPNYVPDPRHSPGCGSVEVVPGEGVFLSAIQYSPNGVEFAPGYNDVSAVAHLDKDGRVLWISSVALTQRGDVSGMEFAEAVAVLSAHSPSPKPTPPKPSMKDEATYREMLIKLLGLKPGDSGEISDEEIIAAVAAKAEAMPADKPTATETVALSARLDRMEKAEENRQRDALLARASAEGKVVPLSAEEAEGVSVAILTAMIDKLPKGEVPLAGAAGGEKPSPSVVALSADEANACRALGLTPEEFRAANPKG